MHLTRRLAGAALIASLALGACSTAGSSTDNPATADAAASSPAPATSRDEPEQDRAETLDGPGTTELDRLVGLFTTRADASDTLLDRRVAGEHLLARASRDASVDDYAAALAQLRRATELDPSDTPSLVNAGRAALGVHRFEEAADDADAVLAADPSDPDALALATDAATARGDLDVAQAHLDRLLTARGDDPAVVVRSSQLASTRGDMSAARSQAEEAIELARGKGLDATDLAFYQSVAGHLATLDGDTARARELLEPALEARPDDHGILGELARVEAAEGNHTAAIDLLDTANSIVPEPDHLVLAGDIKMLVGDTDGAATDYEAAVAEATRTTDHERAWRRALVSYLVDHDGDLDRALTLALDEIAERHDAGAWDLLAWVHHRRGERAEARTAIDTALSLATPSARISFHAGAIADAEGHADAARSLLCDALEGSPRLEPLAALEATQVLGSMECRGRS